MSIVYKQSAFKTAILTGKICDSDGLPHYRPWQGYLLAKQAYYKGKPLITDLEFDTLENMMREKYPECPALEVVGDPKKEDFIELNEWIFNIRAKVL